MGNIVKSLAAAVATIVSFGSAWAEANAYWEYDAAATPQTISDGEWTIVVDNPSEHELRIGPGQNNDKNPRTGDGRTVRPWAVLAEYTAPEHGILDLSKPVYTKGGTDEAWTITDIAWNAFCDFPEVKSFTAPKTLKSCAGQVFMGMKNLTQAVFDCPELTGVFGEWGSEFGGGTPLSKLVLKMPKATRIGRSDGVANFSTATFAETDLNDWNLTGVTELGYGALQAGAWNGVGPTGMLKLPNVATIARSAFYHWSRIETAELGTSGSLKSLGMTLFGGNHGSTKSALRKVDFGRSYAFTVDPQAFYLDVKDEKGGADTPLSIEEFWFAYRAPKATVLDNLLALRTIGEDGTKPITVFAPTVRDSWKALTSEMTEAEKTAAAALEAETGLTIAGVYETADGRRPAWLVGHIWEYDAATATISDGDWTISVSNPNGRELAVGPAAADRADGRTKAPYAFPKDNGSQNGVLDLTGTIYTKGAVGNKDEIWTITELCDQAFRNATGLTSFTAPTTLKKMGVVVFTNTTGLKEVIFDCPEMEGTFACSARLSDGKVYEFYGSPVENMVLKMPKVTAIGSTDGELYNFTSINKVGATFLKTDVSAWDLSGVKNVYRGALQAAGMEDKNTLGGSTGELNLPNVETIGQGAFDMWTQLSTLRLGTSGTLKSIGKTFIWNGTGAAMVGPKKIDFGASWDFTVDETAFHVITAKPTEGRVAVPMPFESLWFTDKAPSIQTLDRILTLRTGTAVTADSAKIYAPVGKPTWVALTQPVSDDEAVAAAELKAQGLDVAGVYQTEAGERVAWIVRNPEIQTPAFLIRIR